MNWMNGDADKDGPLPYVVRTLLDHVDRLVARIERVEKRMTSAEAKIDTFDGIAKMVRTHDRILIGYVNEDNEIVDGVLQTVADVGKTIKKSHGVTRVQLVIAASVVVTAVSTFYTGKDHGLGALFEAVGGVLGHLLHGFAGAVGSAVVTLPP